MNTFLLSTLALLTLSATLFAGTDTCGSTFRLNHERTKTLVPHATSDASDLSIASRLEIFRHWLIQKEKPCSTIVSDLKTRYDNFYSVKKFEIDTKEVCFVGDTSAQVSIIMYISMSCPLCKRLYVAMDSAVNFGALKGKAKLGVKPFSGSSLDVALCASARHNKQNELIRALAPVKERLTMELIIHVMDSLGVQPAILSKMCRDTSLQRIAMRSANEGRANGVTVTPTFFINNKRYHGYKDPRWVIDATEVEYEMIKRQVLPNHKN